MPVPFSPPVAAIVHAIRAGRSSATFLPYVLGGFDDRRKEGIFQSGVDIKSRFGPSRFYGTINPDFRTVERAILSLDFSYFERLAPETRPFFSEGQGFFSPAFFASQRINRIDVGGKLYGSLDSKTAYGFLQTASFWDENESVVGVTRTLDRFGNGSLAFKNLHNLGIDNQFWAGGLDYKLGSFRFGSDVQMTRDNHLGSGQSFDAALSYNEQGIFGRLGVVSTSAGFLDRLGYYTEPDVKGVDATAGLYRSCPRGSVKSVSLSAFTSQYRFQNNEPYRDYSGGSASVEFRGGTGLRINHTVGRFLANEDHVTDTVITQKFSKKGDAHVEVSSGRLASTTYSDILAGVSWKLTPLFRVWGTYQHVSHFAKTSQSIAQAEYRLSNNESLSGRLVQFQSRWNLYLRYRKIRQDGTEVEIMLGDPNALSSTRSVIVKLVVPLEVKF